MFPEGAGRCRVRLGCDENGGNDENDGGCDRHDGCEVSWLLSLTRTGRPQRIEMRSVEYGVHGLVAVVKAGVCAETAIFQA